MQKFVLLLEIGDIYNQKIGDIYNKNICENVRPTLIFGLVEVSLGAPGMLLVLMVTIGHWWSRPNRQGLYTFKQTKAQVEYSIAQQGVA